MLLLDVLLSIHQMDIVWNAVMDLILKMVFAVLKDFMLLVQDVSLALNLENIDYIPKLQTFQHVYISIQL